MADKTGIEWTDATWNPIVGCSIVSPGCTNCYAMSMAARIEAMQPNSHYAGTTKKVNGNAVWTGKMVLAPDHILLQPLKWKKPRKIFVNSMGDLFHESVPDEWIDEVFAVMALCPQHTFQVLTKRSRRMRDYMVSIKSNGRHCPSDVFDRVTEKAQSLKHLTGESIHSYDWPPNNVWLGVSAEDQTRADERIPDLLATPAAVRFVSAEPLLGPIYFTLLDVTDGNTAHLNSLTGNTFIDGNAGQSSQKFEGPKLDWIIVGGESGPKARPMHPDWVRSIRNQCEAASTAFFFKQWGKYIDADQWLQSLSVGKPTVDGQNLIQPLNYRLAEGLARACGIKKYMHESDGRTTFHTGKTRAGNLLDGKIHNQFPEVM